MPRRSLVIALLSTMIGGISGGIPSATTVSSTWNRLQESTLQQRETGDGYETAAERQEAARTIAWHNKDLPEESPDRLEEIHILAINDFHGHLSAEQYIEHRPVGGAAVLASYLQAAQAGGPDSNLADKTFIVHAGDHVGASPPESSFFQDEPSIAFFNLLGNRHCTYEDRMIPTCNLVGTPGNHEFDEGKEEMLRLIRGGNHRSGPFLERPYRGALFPYVSANVVEKLSGEPILPPYVIKDVNGIRLAFIGAVLSETPSLVTPTGIQGLGFLDEASSINRYVRQLREIDNIRTFVVLIHQGGRQRPYEGDTSHGDTVLGKAIEDIIHALDDDVDLVVSGHTHSFTNALVKNQHGREILLTQAFSYGTAYADIHLRIDRLTGDVVGKSAAIRSTFADAGPGLTPEPRAAELVTQAEARVAPYVRRVIGNAAEPVLRSENEAGESALGNLIADAQRAALGTDFAFMNPGGIRADLPAGPVTYRDLFAVHPFGNALVRISLTGRQIYELLNRQWLDQLQPRMLKVSGLSYSWDGHRPIGDRIVEIRKDGNPLDLTAIYSVTVNDFLAAGGDRFSVLTQSPPQAGGPIDLKALIAYIEKLPQPFNASIENRIVKVN